MKRLLSILLAIMMVATLLPAGQVFATEGETADVGYTIKYDIGGFMDSRTYRWNESGPWLWNMTYDTTNGLFEFVKTTAVTLKGDEKNTVQGTNTFDGKQNRSSNLTVAFGGSYRYLQLKGTITFKINVPVSDTYKIDVNYQEAQNKPNAIVSLYITDYIIDNVDDETPVGKYSCYTTETARNNLNTRVKANDSEEDAEVTLNAGEYYLTISSGEYGYIRSLSLVSGDGSKVFLNNINASSDRAVLIPGTVDSAKISVESMHMSDASAVSDMEKYPVSYKSNNAAVAEVSNDGTVTAVSKGEAIITVSAENEIGEVVSCDVPIIVRDDIKVLYDVNNDMTALGMTWRSNADSTIDESGKTAFQRRPSVYELNFNSTNGFYAFHSAGQGVLSDTNQTDDNMLKYTSANKKGTFQVRRNNWMALEIYVPEAGVYDFEMYANETTGFSGTMKVFVSDRAGNVAEKNYVGTYCGYNATPSTTPVTKRIGSCAFEKAGNYIVTFTNVSSADNSALVDAFALVGGTKDTIVNGKITSTASSINVDEGESATVSATGFNSATTEAATFTYTSNNPAIAEVDATSGVVTPKAEGKVTITATANGAEVANTLTTDITVTVNKPGEAIADTMVNVGIEAMTGGAVETNLAEVVSEVEIGTEVSAKAIAADGYEFAYWADSTGKVLSTKAEETFKINVNTSVKAYFDKIPTEEDTKVPVYFYNGNGALISSCDADKGTTFGAVKIDAPTLTGFEFNGWSIADNAIINALTRAVALYIDGADTYTVKVGDKEVASGKKYGESVTVSSDAENFVCWKLGEKVMSYEKTFEFDVYGDITLTEVTGEPVSAVPTVVLDIVGGEYFLTYNVPAEYTKIEAGILFSESGKPDIGSFYSKATEKTGSGQFTAMPNGTKDTIARGYMIFRDADNSIRVIYAD